MIEEGDLKKRIKRAQEGDERVVKAVEELKRAGIKTLKNEEWEIEDGIVTKEGRCYESPKKETVSHTFKYFIQNLKLYNGVKE